MQKIWDFGKTLEANQQKDSEKVAIEVDDGNGIYHMYLWKTSKGDILFHPVSNYLNDKNVFSYDTDMQKKEKGHGHIWLNTNGEIEYRPAKKDPI